MTVFAPSVPGNAYFGISGTLVANCGIKLKVRSHGILYIIVYIRQGCMTVFAPGVPGNAYFGISGTLVAYAVSN